MRALLDLLLPASCAACGRPGALACADCEAALLAAASIAWPTPAPPGLPPPFAVADYAGTTRTLLLAYKERDQVALTSVLAAALRAALARAATAAGTSRG